MAGRKPRAAGPTGRAEAAKAAGGPRRTKTTLRLGDQVRRELAVVAAEQGRDMADIAEEALASHLGKFAVIRDLRRRAGAPAEGEPPAVEPGEPAAA